MTTISGTIQTVHRYESRSVWRSASAAVIRAAKNEICTTPHGKVRHQYIEQDALPDADFIMYKQDRDRHVTGFLIGKYKASKVHIIVVCSKEKGLGKRLILETFLLGRASERITHVSLDALPHTTGYYPRFGFHFPDGRKVGSNTDGYYMEKDLSNTVNWNPSVTPVPSQPAKAQKRGLDEMEEREPQKPTERRVRRRVRPLRYRE